MNIILGLGAAFCFGVSDFSGGIATRRTGLFRVLVFGQSIGLVIAMCYLPFFPMHPHFSDLLFGALAGAAIAFVLKFLFSAMQMGDISVTSPVLAVVGTSIPIVYGLITGNLPSTNVIVGVLLAPVSIIFVTAPEMFTRKTYLDGLKSPQGRLCVLAGLMYGLEIIFLGHIRAQAGAIPIVINRLTCLAIVLVFFRNMHKPEASAGWRTLSLFSGAVAIVGTLMFILSAQRGPLEVPAALYSFTPACVIALSVVLLHEKLRRVQYLGIALVLLALVLISIG